MAVRLKALPIIVETLDKCSYWLSVRGREAGPRLSPIIGQKARHVRALLVLTSLNRLLYGLSEIKLLGINTAEKYHYPDRPEGGGALLSDSRRNEIFVGKA